MSNQKKNKAPTRIYVYIFGFLLYLVIFIVSNKTGHFSSATDNQILQKHNPISWDKAISETEDELPVGILIYGIFIVFNERKYRKKKDESA